MNSESIYELVYSPTPTELSETVTERISEGWWPLGTPFVHGEDYIQAMVLDRIPDKRLRRSSGEG